MRRNDLFEGCGRQVRQQTPIRFCSDTVRTNVFGPDVSALLTAAMRANNPRIERHGILVHGGSVFGLQVERMLREAQHPARRTFRGTATLQEWLGEALTAPERIRLAEFLADSPDGIAEANRPSGD